MSVVLRIETL